MWDTVFPYLLSGISVGGQYALIAIGYTMVYGILRLINFAHGDVFMVAGIVMVYIAASGIPLWISVPAVLIITAVIGFVIERVAYKPLRSAPRMSVMISAIGVSYTLQNLVLYITGGLNKQYPAIPGISASIQIGSATTKVVTVITPILVILLVMFYVVFAASHLTAVTVAIITYSLFFAAGACECFRTGIASVDPLQREAALSLGFTPLQAYRYVVVPQSMKTIIPLFKGRAIGLIENTSIVGFIAIKDLTKVIDVLRNQTYESVISLGILALIYFLLTRLIGFCLDWIGNKILSRHA